MPAVCLQFVLVCVFLSKTSPKRRPFLDPELRVFVFQMENLESPSPLSSFFSPFLGEEKANVWSTRHVTRREGGRLGGLELLRGFDDRFSPSCCIPNLTDSRAFSVFLLSERLKRSSMRTQATQTDTSKRNGVVPNQSHILNLQKVSARVFTMLPPQLNRHLKRSCRFP